MDRAVFSKGDAAQCGFCLRSVVGSSQGKVLPCSHVHCSKCLTSHYNINKIVKCPLPSCRQVFDVKVDKLPAPGDGEESLWCDICLNKDGADMQEAVSYCTICSSRYCPKHKQWHDEGHSQHKQVGIDEYKKYMEIPKARTCAKHKNQQLVLGCRACRTLLCVSCFSGLGDCVNGKLHEPIPINELTAELTDSVLKQTLMSKEEQLDALYKETARTLADFDSNTEELLKLLHRTRDEQMMEVKVKYTRLEKELLQLRSGTREKLNGFLEENVGSQLSELRNHRLRIEGKLRRSHQVDIIGGYNQMKFEAQRLIKDPLPTLAFEDTVELKPIGKQRDIELAIITADGILIESNRVTTAPDPLPKFLTLTKSVNVPDRPISVYHYKRYTYVGLDDKRVTRIDESYRPHNSFITCTGAPESIFIHKDRIYILVYRNPRLVCVYDMSGNHVTQWKHPDATPTYYSNALVILSDQVLVADRTNKRIALYTPLGEIIRHISCPMLGQSLLAMCPVDASSLVLSDYDTSQLCRLDIRSGEDMWLSEAVGQPGGVTCHKGKFVAVTGYHRHTITVLDVQTGAVLSEMTDEAMGDSLVLGLHTVGKYLIVPKRDQNKVLYYLLRKFS